MAPASSEVHHEPFGVCLIIGAFNYPICLSLQPLIGAIAAGNCAVLKPSELAPRCEEILQILIARYMDPECFSVKSGGVDTTTILLDQKWDKIFFTGSPRVGKIVAMAAAKNLTPVSLELGGKSPVIVDNTITDLALVTRRIMWGNCANTGQTCIAPDYIICEESMVDTLIEGLVKTVGIFYGEGDKIKGSDLGRIISKAHCERLHELIKANKKHIVYGGDVDVSQRYVQPTIFKNVPLTSSLMKQEIFGPLLPIVTYRDTSDILDIIAENEKPLAMYIFSKNRKFIDSLIGSVQSGGVVVNDLMYHFGSSYLPFGGIGNSGVGFYHGKYSFDCFSHKRSVLRRDDHNWLDVPFRYPPYTNFGLNFFRTVTSYLPPLPAITGNGILNVCIIAAVVGGIIYYYK